MENATMPFILPYRFHLFYQVNDSRTWALTYLSHFPFVFVSGFGQTAADCLMVTLVFHVSGKLASLAIRISEINTEQGVCKQELRSIIIEHDRLLKYVEIFITNDLRGTCLRQSWLFILEWARVLKKLSVKLFWRIY